MFATGRQARTRKIIARNEGALRAILLDARGPQAGQTVLVDRILPGKEFFDSQRIAAAGLFEGKQPATHGGDHLRLAANDPALRPRRGKIRDRQGTAIGPDDVLHPRAMGSSHWYTHKLD